MIAKYKAASPGQVFGGVIQKGLEAREAVRDVGRIGASFSPFALAPVWMAAAEKGLSSINSAGAQKAYELLGDQENANRIAQQREQAPDINALMAKYSDPLRAKTQGGQEVERKLYKALEGLPVVTSGPRGSGVVASGERRPMLTPTDVTVGAGQVKQLAKELRETPADFQAAQSGLKRQNLYGEDTLGVKAQAAADALGDTLERRRAEGKSPLMGPSMVTDMLAPETKMYAMRPGGTKITRPTVPATAGDYRPAHSAINDIVSDAYGENIPVSAMPVATLTYEYGKRFLSPNTAATALVSTAFNNFQAKKIGEMYPDASSLVVAQQMFDTEFSNPEAKAKKKSEMLEEFMASPESLPVKQEHAALKFLDSAPGKKAVQQFNIDQFVQTPEGAEIAAGGKTKLAEFLKTPAGKQVLYTDSAAEFLQTPAGQKIKEQITLPSFSEFTDRYREAERILKGPLSNFLASDIGAEKSKTVALAREGIVPGTREDVEYLDQFADRPSLARIRTAAGYPAMGTYYDDRTAALYKRDQLAREIEELDTQLQPLIQQSMEQRVLPEQIEGYADLNKQIRKKRVEAEKNKQDIDNLKLAVTMEDITDSTVRTKSTEEMKSSIPERELPFFPSVTKARPEETHYVAIDRVLRDLGFGELAKSLQEDILLGNLGDTKNLSIEKYMRIKHGERELQKQFEQDKAEQYIFQVQNRLKQRLDSDPNVKRIGNAAFIESTKDTPKDVALADASAATAVLDHCVGEGARINKDEFHPFTGRKTRNYLPIIDPLTGQRSEGVSPSKDSAYVSGLRHGNELVHVVDPETGLPKGTLELNKFSDEGFTIGYASGIANGSIDPSFVPAIRNYLNRRADEIKSAGSNLSDHTGIYDTRDAQGFRSAVRAAKLSEADGRALGSMTNLPRFLTAEDLKRIYETEAPAVPTEVAVRDEAPAAELTERDYQNVVDNYNEALMNAARDALENSNLQNPERVELGVNNIATGFFDLDLNNQANFLADPVYQIRRVETALEDRIANLHAQGSEYHSELADALDNFLIDVRGIRGNVERRLRMAAERAAAQQVEARLNQAPAPAVQGGQYEPMPTTMSADDLLNAHGHRMDREQQQWLEGFIENWDAGGDFDMMTRQYDDWLANNMLQPDPAAFNFDRDAFNFEPDPTAVANRPGGDQPLTAMDRFLLDTFDGIVNDAIEEGSLPRGMANSELAQFVLDDEVGGLEDLLPEDRTRLAELLNRRDGGNQAPDQAYTPQDLLLARRLLEIEREPDGSIRQAGIDSTAYALQTGQLDHPSVNHIPPGPERAARLEPVLRAFIEEVATERRPGNAPDRDQQQLARNYELLQETITDPNNQVDVDNIDINELLDSLRNPEPLSPFYDMPLEQRRALADYVQVNGFMDAFPGAPAPRVVQQPAPQLPGLAGRDPYEMAAQYNVPPGMIRGILAESNGPVERLFELLNESLTPAGRFETLPEDSRLGAVQLIRDILTERQQTVRNARQQAAPQLAQNDAVPRNVLEMSRLDLLQSLERPQQQRAREIAEAMFRGNTFDGNTPLSAATSAVRMYAIGPAEGVGPLVREQAARNLEQMYTEAQQDAQSIAGSLREVFYDDQEGPEQSQNLVMRDLGDLRRRGELVWEDILGPMAEDIPWSPTINALLVENLETIRDEYQEQIDQRDNGYAKGGMVKKKRKAKKPTMALVVTRKNPELAEIAYRYGGMVR
jgi:hypothetical protein